MVFLCQQKLVGGCQGRPSQDRAETRCHIFSVQNGLLLLWGTLHRWEHNLTLSNFDSHLVIFNSCIVSCGYLIFFHLNWCFKDILHEVTAICLQKIVDLSRTVCSSLGVLYFKKVTLRDLALLLSESAPILGSINLLQHLCAPLLKRGCDDFFSTCLTRGT